MVLALVAVILRHTALCHQRPPDQPIIPIIGTVKAISGNHITVDSGGRTITVITDGHTQVWKGKLRMISDSSKLATTLQDGADPMRQADSWPT